jgi:hypothetical protein
MRATMRVAAQLRIWVAHFVPPVHAMPDTSDRSSSWLSVFGGGRVTVSSAIVSSALVRQ